MRDFMAVTKALGDPNRVRVINILGKRELCVCQITALLKLAPSTVSKHMSILHQARLVEARKDGRWIYYRLSRRAVAPVHEAIRWVRRSLSGTAEATRDAAELKRILAIDQEELCRIQNRD